MKTAPAKLIINILISVLIALALTTCKDELTGVEAESVPPATEILNIPAPNSIDNPYSPILKVGWKGISQNSIIKGFWISWESHYLIKNEVVVQEPYFSEEVTQVIPFPSADSINKQILLVRAEDINGKIDPAGDTVVFYTSRTLPPETSIEYPYDNSTSYIMDEPTILWKGVKIFCRATSKFGAVKDFAVRIDGGAWSGWQSDSVFAVTGKIFDGVTPGKHLIEVISRNTALVEDQSPASIFITFVKPSHQKEWLIIDDTKDQNGSLERPNDEQVDQFYEKLLSDVQHDNWDIINNGNISRQLLGNYKNVLWHCDDKGKTTLPQNAGILIDYMNTKGRLLVSGWSYLDYFDPEGSWADSIKYFGNFLRDYLHINGYRTIDDALLDSVYVIKNIFSAELVPIDSNKIWNFRQGLFKVMNFSIPGRFTEPLFLYHSADTTANNYMYSNIGMGYNNSEYRLVVTGFPFYYLTEEAARVVFLRAKEYLEEFFTY